jgi:hypothetical protein
MDIALMNDMIDIKAENTRRHLENERRAAEAASRR